MYDTERLMLAYCILQFAIRVLASLCHFACWYTFPVTKTEGLELTDVGKVKEGKEGTVIENKMAQEQEKSGS